MLTASPASGGLTRPGERLGRVVGQPVDVADLEPPAGARLVDLDDEAHAVVHRHGQGLGATHAAEARGQGHRAAERAAEVLAGRLGERLVRALQDALGPDVDPGARRHLAVHHQAGLLELPEDLPGRPFPDEVRVGDEDPWCPLVGPQDTHRFAGLDEQRLVVAELAQFPDDGVEGVPAPGRAAGAAVDDQMIRVLGDLGIEVVHEHPEGRLLRPAAAGQLRAAGRADGTGSGHALSLLPQPGHEQFAKVPRADRGDRHQDVVGQGDVVGLGTAVAGSDEDLAPADLLLVGGGQATGRLTGRPVVGRSPHQVARLGERTGSQTDDARDGEVVSLRRDHPRDRDRRGIRGETR